MSDDRTQVARTAAGRSRQVAGQATDEAQNVASAAAERSGELMRSAKDDALQIVETVKSHAGEVSGQLSTKGRSLVQETRAQLVTQAQTGTQKAAGTLRQFGEQAQALAEGRPEDAEQLTEYVWKVADNFYGAADKLHGLSEDIEVRGVSGILDDLQSFARRRPGAFLLGAVAVGFGVGRLVKANNESEDEDEDSEELDEVAPRAVPARSRAAMR